MFRRLRFPGRQSPPQDGAPQSATSHQLVHSHGAIDAAIFASQRGIWATKVSLLALLGTAAIQVLVFLATGSVALLADTVHNIGDAATAVPLWVAFVLAKKLPTRRFTDGLGRAEDLAGLLIVATILVSGAIAGYESIRRLSSPPEVNFIWAVVAAGVTGFFGNEAVALFRIKIGKEIGSPLWSPMGTTREWTVDQPGRGAGRLRGVAGVSSGGSYRGPFDHPRYSTHRDSVRQIGPGPPAGRRAA